MQVAQGQVLVGGCALVQAASGCCICTYCHQLAQILHLHSWWSSPATCTGDVVSMPTGVLILLRCTNTLVRALQLALCDGGGMHMYICVFVWACACVCVCVCMHRTLCGSGEHVEVWAVRICHGLGMIGEL